jgi:hypothetical protein
MSTPEMMINAHLAAKREAAGADPAPAPDVPSHSEALTQGRESYPDGQRGE